MKREEIPEKQQNRGKNGHLAGITDRLEGQDDLSGLNGAEILLRHILDTHSFTSKGGQINRIIYSAAEYHQPR